MFFVVKVLISLIHRITPACAGKRFRLMGKKVGEIAEAQVPSGTLRLRIDSITLG